MKSPNPPVNSTTASAVGPRVDRLLRAEAELEAAIAACTAALRDVREALVCQAGAASIVH